MGFDVSVLVLLVGEDEEELVGKDDAVLEGEGREGGRGEGEGCERVKNGVACRSVEE